MWVALLSAGVAFWLRFVGGFDVTVLQFHITSHDPWRPAIVAAVAGVLFLVSTWRVDLRPWLAATDRLDDRLVAGALAVAVCIVGIAYATTAASGSDSYGYVSEADAWLTGHLKTPQPWTKQAPWPSSSKSFAPLGYRPGEGADALTLVPTYSPGLPLLMAAAKLVGGQEGMFWVVPIAGGLLVLTTFGLGRRLGDSRAGLAAAWLVATSPVVLYMLMWPMTDVPVAAAWILASYFALGDSTATAIGAGLAAATAILIRPNLVFQAGPIGLWYLLRGWRSGTWGRGERQAALFAVVTSAGIVAVAAINRYLYGSPFESGYGGFSDWFSAGNVATNARNYLQWLTFAHTPAALLGLAALVVPLKRLWPGVRDRAVFVFTGLFLVTLTAQYLAFLVFDVWWYLRFLIAALPFLLLGVGAAATATARLRKPILTLAVIAAIVGLGIRSIRLAAIESAFDLWRGERRYVSVAKLVRAATDESSVIYCMQHSGSLRYYAGRLTLRYSELEKEWLDRSVAWVLEQGSHPYMLLESWEVEPVRSQFAGQKTLAALDTAPIFIYEGGARVMLYDLAAAPNRTARTIKITETFDDRERSVRPLPPPAIILGR